MTLNGLLIFPNVHLWVLSSFFISSQATSSAEFCHLPSSAVWSDFITSPANLLVQCIFSSDECGHLPVSLRLSPVSHFQHNNYNDLIEANQINQIISNSRKSSHLTRIAAPPHRGQLMLVFGWHPHLESCCSFLPF